MLVIFSGLAKYKSHRKEHSKITLLLNLIKEKYKSINDLLSMDKHFLQNGLRFGSEYVEVMANR